MSKADVKLEISIDARPAIREIKRIRRKMWWIRGAEYAGFLIAALVVFVPLVGAVVVLDGSGNQSTWAGVAIGVLWIRVIQILADWLRDRMERP